MVIMQLKTLSCPKVALEEASLIDGVQFGNTLCDH
jgi:hypothetical protein